MAGKKRVPAKSKGKNVKNVKSLTKPGVSTTKTFRVPFGVKIISTFSFIVAFFGIGAGIQYLSLDFGSTESYFLAGITAILIGAFNFAIGVGLWKGSRWARSFAILFMIFMIFLLVGIHGLSIFLDLSILIFFLAHLLALLYLLFHESSKKSFS